MFRRKTKRFCALTNSSAVVKGKKKDPMERKERSPARETTHASQNGKHKFQIKLNNLLKKLISWSRYFLVLKDTNFVISHLLLGLKVVPSPWFSDLNSTCNFRFTISPVNEYDTPRPLYRLQCNKWNNILGRVHVIL